MKTFEVTVNVTGTETYTVKAETEQEAREEVLNGGATLSTLGDSDLHIDSIDRVDEVQD